MNKKAIIIIGKPGSGKGTQAKLLADKLGFFHFTTSQVGRDYIKTHKDEETQRQLELSNKGLYWETHWLLEVVKEKIQEIFLKVKGIVFDGSPRTLYEAEHFLPFLIGLFGKENLKIIEIRISDEEVIRRIEKRLVCRSDVNHIFIQSESLIPGRACPEGDGVLEERIDDSAEKARRRLKEYYEDTLPALKHLKKEHGVLEINGERAIKDVHQDIMMQIYK